MHIPGGVRRVESVPRRLRGNRTLFQRPSALIIVGAIALLSLTSAKVALAQEPTRTTPIGQPSAILDEELNADSELAKALRSPQPEVRFDALARLAKKNPRGQARTYFRALADTDPRVSIYATLEFHIRVMKLREPRKSTKSLPEVDASLEYDHLIAQTESPVVRGLLAIAFERSSPDVEKAMPWALKGLERLDANRRQPALFMLASRKDSDSLQTCFPNNDAEVRRGYMRVAHALVESDRESRSFLDPAEKALRDSDPEVRGIAILTLASTKLPDERFVEMTKDKDAFVRTCAIRAIQQRKSVDLTECLAPLAQSDPSVRVRLRAALGLREFVATREGDEARDQAAARIKLTGIPRALFEHLSGADDPFQPWEPTDEQPLTAAAADEMVAQIAAAMDEERRQPLPPHQALYDDSDSDNFDTFLLTCIAECCPFSRAALPRLLDEVRKFDSLGDGDDPSSPEARPLERIWGSLQYYALLKEETTAELVRALSDSHRIVRTVAALALAEERAYQAKCVPVLIESLSYDCPGQFAYGRLKRWDVMSLASAGHLAVPALLEQIRLERNVPLAVMALDFMPGDSANVIPLLLKTFNDPQSTTAVRCAIAAPLGQLGEEDRKVYEAFSRRLQDRSENEDVRCAAAHGLAKTAVNNPYELLSNFKNDESPKVREAVRQEIERYIGRSPG